MPKADRHDSFVVREGLPFAVPLFLATLAAFWTGIPWLAWPLLFVTLFVAWFFRNPERRSPDNPGRSSPGGREGDPDRGGYQRTAAGTAVPEDQHLHEHLQRPREPEPLSGEIVSIRYREGKFLSANLDKASALNERNTLLIRTDDGRQIVVVRSRVDRQKDRLLGQGRDKGGQGRTAGPDPFRFAGRGIPAARFDVLVKVGDKVRAGETP